MLSILIPTYNQSCLALAEELSIELDILDIDGEIIVLDDASTAQNVINELSDIEELDHCRVVRHETNLGPSRARQTLTEEAQYDNLLFLDADAFPATPEFLERFVSELGQSDVIFGGMRYRSEGRLVNPLRLAYGKRYEVYSVYYREKNPYVCFNAIAFLVKKSIMEQVAYDEAYGCSGPGDTLLALKLQEMGIKIKHIYNPVFHDDTDTSDQFLSKSRTAVDMMCLHMDKLEDVSRMIWVYKRLRTFGLNKVLHFLFKNFKSKMEKNLLGDTPSVALLNVYKLSYMSCVMKLM